MGWQSSKFSVNFLSCKCCGGELKLKEDRKAKKGLSRMMLIVCSSCEFVCKLPGSKEMKSGKITFAELNRKSAMAIRSLGHGRADLARFRGYMNIITTFKCIFLPFSQAMTTSNVHN